MNTGDRIKKLRDKLSRVAFAEKIGVSHQYISKIESGGSLPSVEVAMKIAEVFNVSLDWIYTGKSSAQSDPADPESISIKKDRYIEILEENQQVVHELKEVYKQLAEERKVKYERLKNIADTGSTQ